MASTSILGTSCRRSCSSPFALLVPLSPTFAAKSVNATTSAPLMGWPEGSTTFMRIGLIGAAFAVVARLVAVRRGLRIISYTTMGTARTPGSSTRSAARPWGVADASFAPEGDAE